MASPAPSSSVAPAAAATTAPPPASEADGGQPSGGMDIINPVGPNRLLEELRQYHSGTCRERAEFQRERDELMLRLTKLEQEIHVEDQIGHDLLQRIEILEQTMQKERIVYDGILQNSASQPGFESDNKGIIDMSGMDSVATVCATYLARLPDAQEHSCVEALRERLLKAGIPFSPNCAGDVRTPGVKDWGPATLAMDVVPQQRTIDTEMGGIATRPSLDEIGVSGIAGGVDEKAESDGKPLAEGPPLATWEPWLKLSSHLDGVRCVLYDELGETLISCGEDALVKAWEIGPPRRSTLHNDTVEPYLTLRGHSAAVLALAYRSADRVLFSAGMDRQIRIWRLPDGRAHRAYGTNATMSQRAMRAGALAGHTNTIWCLQQHPHFNYLASASADGSIGLWSAELDSRNRDAGCLETSLVCRPPDGGTGPYARDPAGILCELPACVSWVPTDVTRLLGGYASSRVAVFDIKRAAEVIDLQALGNNQVALASGTTHLGPASSAAVTSACCHQVMQLAITGHADCRARLIDLVSGRFVAALGGHPDAVTSVCIDPAQGHTVITGCHDGCVRIFDLRTGRCCQQLRVHQLKYSEAVHCVHHAARVIATAGADGHVSVLVPMA